MIMDPAEIIKALIVPSGFAASLFSIALILLLLRRWQRGVIGLLAISGAILMIFSSGPVASLLLRPLEYRYPYLKHPDQYPQADAIVVLAGYAAENHLMPLSSQVNISSAYRILEAKHLSQTCSRCEIIISGYENAPAIMKALLTELNIPASKIQIENNSPHTNASATNLRAQLKNRSFFLVTSAGHMPRAMGVFTKQDLQPIPAPTDYSLPKNPLNAPIAPNPLHLYYSDLAVNEYAGLAWYYLTGKM